MGSTRNVCRGMMMGNFALASLIGALALGGCAPGCPSGLARMDGVRMFFGGSLADADWADFAAGTLTPAFSDGFTTYEAAGQWRDPVRRRLVRERTRVVQVFGVGVVARADTVAAAYRVRFHQVSVGIVSGSACAGF